MGITIAANNWRYGPKMNGDIDQELLAVVRAAAAYLPKGWELVFVSGYRKGDKRFHGKHMALDIQLIDNNGRPLPNYQDDLAFRAYESFAQSVRKAQLKLYPKMPLRWGGYFSGARGKYGALDLMHFDVAGNHAPMGGGSFDLGLTQAQRKLWPRAVSEGMSKV